MQTNRGYVLVIDAHSRKTKLAPESVTCIGGVILLRATHMQRVRAYLWPVAQHAGVILYVYVLYLLLCMYLNKILQLIFLRCYCCKQIRLLHLHLVAAAVLCLEHKLLSRVFTQLHIT